jgi:hypothetical protein
MTETLLSPSNVLLFGRRVEDLQIISPRASITASVRSATTGNIVLNGVPQPVDGTNVRAGRSVLVKNQQLPAENGIYIAQAGPWTRAPVGDASEDFFVGMRVFVRRGGQANTVWQLRTPYPNIGVDPIEFEGPAEAGHDPRHGPFVQPRPGIIGDVEQQLTAMRTYFARIYGFTYEGAYYELPRPALFLVHGEGIPATEFQPRGRPHPARALGSPSLTGLAAADFQFADDLRVWSYDKADYTIRMDVESGMFEDVLLPVIGGGGPGVSGARVSGARVSGARVSGARVSGARLSGGRGDAGD